MDTKEKYRSFFENFTDFIFVEDEPEQADMIFVPGNGYPQMAERAAELWKGGYAPYILPSGKYSVVTGKFSGVLAKEEKYRGAYRTEWEFLKTVLIKNGVDERKILREDQATYTYQNAIFSRQATEKRGISLEKAILCCKAQHARRCKMYYELLYPGTRFLICPSDVGINRENWYLTEEGIREVLGEMRRCGEQFHEILKEL